MYKLRYDVKVQKQLKKLDKQVSKKIVAWLNEKIDNCENPRCYGKALVGNLGEFWRYRIGDYRVLAKIEDTQLLVLAVKINHRKQVYK